jgi:hypothetical protein
MHKFKEIIDKTNTSVKRKVLPQKQMFKNETWNLLPQNANMPKKMESDVRNPKP